MYQLVRAMTLITLLSITAHAAPSTMNDLYSEFQLTRIQLKSTKFSAPSFTSQFRAIDQQLHKKYTAYKALEKDELTSKGNQMAYDIELLEPLKSLANSKMTKDDCQQSLHNNELNYNEDDKQDNETIKKIILTVCK